MSGRPLPKRSAARRRPCGSSWPGPSVVSARTSASSKFPRPDRSPSPFPVDNSDSWGGQSRSHGKNSTIFHAIYTGERPILRATANFMLFRAACGERTCDPPRFPEWVFLGEGCPLPGGITLVLVKKPSCGQRRLSCACVLAPALASPLARSLLRCTCDVSKGKGCHDSQSSACRLARQSGWVESPRVCVPEGFHRYFEADSSRAHQTHTFPRYKPPFV